MSYFLSFTILLILQLLQISQQNEKNIFENKNDSSLVIYLNEQGIKSIQKTILPTIFNSTSIPIPCPAPFETNIDFIGHLKLEIKKLSLKFNEIDDDQLGLEFNEPNSIKLQVQNISGNLNFSYHFTSGFYDSENYGNISFSNLGVNLLSNFTEIKNENQPEKMGPNLIIDSLNIQDNPLLEINFNSSGRMEALIKFFFDLISNSISQEIKQKIKDTNLTQINSQISEYASKLKLEGTTNNVTINYGLNSEPRISKKKLEIALDANLSNNLDNYTYTGNKYNVPHLFEGHDNAPVYGIFNQYLLDGAFTLMEKQGKLNTYIVAETVQSDYFSLDVSGISAFFSSITKYYKSSDKVDLDVKSIAPPSIEFKDKKLLGNFNVTINFLVRQSEKNGTKISALEANFLFKADLDFTIENADLKVKIKSLKIDKMIVINSTIGEVDADKVIRSINTKINIILFAKSSFDIDLSIYLPKIAGLSFNHTSIIPHEGYLEFEVIADEKKYLKENELKEKKGNFIVNTFEKFSEMKNKFKENIEKITEKNDKNEKKNLKFLH